MRLARGPLRTAAGALRQRKKVKELKQMPAGEEASVRGWARQVRRQKKVAFLEVNDGSAMSGLQVVANPESEGFDAIQDGDIALGASVEAQGEMVESPGGKQSVELKASSVRLIGECDPSVYPLQKKTHTLEYLRELAHLRPRTNTMGAVARVRSELSYATHEFFHQEGFLQVHTPVITSLDCEGAGEQFHATTLLSQGRKQEGANAGIDFGQDFFERPAYLTVSGQLNAEAYACALGDVYTFGPAFRAENSNTSRHLSEFWMVEPEMAFADISDAMDCCEAYIRRCIGRVLERCPDEIDFLSERYDEHLRSRLESLVASEFVRLTYSEAIERLSSSGRAFEFEPAWGKDLQTEHERYLCEECFEGKPVFVSDYPTAIKPFYMRVNDADGGKTVAAMDLLLPRVGELVGGSQREDRLDVLIRRMEELGIPVEAYEWYVDLRRYGSVPHAGFGLGFERLVCYVTAMENIRDAIAFPRHPGNAQF